MLLCNLVADGCQPLKQQYDNYGAYHELQAVKELQSFSSSVPTALSNVGFEQHGDSQLLQSVMITGSSDHKLTSEIMDAPIITNFQVVLTHI